MGSVQTGASGRPQSRSAAVVLIIWRHISKTLVEPDGVVEVPAAAEFGLEFAGVDDLVQVRMLALEVPEERLDPGLIIGRCRAPVARSGPRP